MKKLKQKPRTVHVSSVRIPIQDGSKRKRNQMIRGAKYIYSECNYTVHTQ